MKSYAWDSNIVSFYLRQTRERNEPIDRRIAEAKAANISITIPPFVYYEVSRGLLAVNATRQIRNLEVLCGRFPIGAISGDIFLEAAGIYAALRRGGVTIDEMDIFIAAWCRMNNCILVTNNIGHFAAVPGLSVEDWSV